MVMWSRARQVLLASAFAGLALADAAAQQVGLTVDQISLQHAIVERFEVIPLTDGLALSPRDEDAAVRLVQLEDGTIALDGAVVSGQELRDRLGSDGDLVVRLSYVDEAIRLRMFDVRDADVEDAPSNPNPMVALPRATSPRRRITSSGIVKLGGPVRIGVDERVEGDVVVLGGPLTVDGSVGRDVVVLGGPAVFGPQSEVGGEVTVIGGPVTRAPTAALHGGIHEVVFDGIDFSGIDLRELIRFRTGPVGGHSWLLGGWDIAGTLIRLILLALLASIVVFVAQGSVERVSERSAIEPVKSGIAGFLTEILLAPIFVLGILLLVVSIIGIPLLVLLPFAIIGVFVAMLVGFAGSAHALGCWLGRRLGRDSQPVYMSVWFGIALILMPAIVGTVVGIGGGPFRVFAVLMALTGALVEYATWTTGLGALVLNRFGSPLTQQGISSPPSLPDTGPHTGMASGEPGGAPSSEPIGS